MEHEVLAFHSNDVAVPSESGNVDVAVFTPVVALLLPLLAVSQFLFAFPLILEVLVGEIGG